MSTDSEMILVTALIRPYMEVHVVQSLHDLPEFPGFTFTATRGQGRCRGQGGSYVSSNIDLTYHQFLGMRLVCRSEFAGEVCGRIASAPWTGRKGDGVVFTTPVRTFARMIGRREEKRDD